MWRGRTLAITWVCPPAILRAPINARTSSVYGTAAHFASSQQRLWVVYGRTGQGTMAGADVYLQKWLAFGDPASKVSFGNDIVTMRLDLRSIRSVSRQDQIK